MTAVHTEGGLVAGMVALARSLGGAGRSGGALSVLSNRSGGLVIRFADVVVKAHPPGTDSDALRARLAAVADPELAGLVVPPLRADRDGGLVFRACGRAVTAWPAGEPVAPDDPDAAPWEDAATLLARLHAVGSGAFPSGLPAAGAAPRVGRAITRMRAATVGSPVSLHSHDRCPGEGSTDAAVVERAFAALPPWVTGAAPAPGTALIHGDWHLGQLIRGAGGVAGWRLVDVDDLGTGDPLWDLARPAALFAAGVLDPAAWYRFLGAYRAAGGCALPPRGDPWPALDLPARALAVQLAASGVADASDAGRAPDGVEQALLDACRRMVGGAGAADVS